MKKPLLILMASFTVFACSVDEDLPLEDGTLTKSDLSYSGENCTGLAGGDNSLRIEYSEAEAMGSWDEVRDLYLSLLDPEVNTDGTFEPTIWELIDQFNEQGLGDLTTNYTVSNGECSDSAMLTVTVVPDGQGDQECEVHAGSDNSHTITESEANSLGSWDEVRNLYLSIVSPEAPTNGSFNPSISDLINSFTGVGEYTTNYTVGEGDCTDSAVVTLIVVPDSEPACEVSAGPDNSITITESEANSLGSWDEVRNLYLDLLSPEVPTNGNFNPDISDVINSYNGVGEYSTIYTVGEGDCTDSATLTLIVVPDAQGDPACEINAGPDNSRTILQSEAAAIGSWEEVKNMYLDLLAPGVAHNGTFDPTIWDLIEDFQERKSGNFTTTYTVSNGECSDSVELTITVIPD